MNSILVIHGVLKASVDVHKTHVTKLKTVHPKHNYSYVHKRILINKINLMTRGINCEKEKAIRQIRSKLCECDLFGRGEDISITHAEF